MGRNMLENDTKNQHFVTQAEPRLNPCRQLVHTSDA